MPTDIPTLVSNFEADIAIAHNIIHGDDVTDVSTDSGLVPTFAKVLKNFGEPTADAKAIVAATADATGKENFSNLNLGYGANLARLLLGTAVATGLNSEAEQALKGLALPQSLVRIALGEGTQTERDAWSLLTKCPTEQADGSIPGIWALQDAAATVLGAGQLAKDEDGRPKLGDGSSPGGRPWPGGFRQSFVMPSSGTPVVDQPIELARFHIPPDFLTDNMPIHVGFNLHLSAVFGATADLRLVANVDQTDGDTLDPPEDEGYGFLHLGTIGQNSGTIVGSISGFVHTPVSGAPGDAPALLYSNRDGASPYAGMSGEGVFSNVLASPEVVGLSSGGPALATYFQADTALDIVVNLVVTAGTPIAFTTNNSPWSGHIWLDFPNTVSV